MAAMLIEGKRKNKKMEAGVDVPLVFWSLPFYSFFPLLLERRLT
jgi:hypothetical protein